MKNWKNKSQKAEENTKKIERYIHKLSKQIKLENHE